MIARLPRGVGDRGCPVLIRYSAAGSPARAVRHTARLGNTVAGPAVPSPGPGHLVWVTDLGRHRWTVERTVAWLAGCRRPHRRYERKAEHFLAFAGTAGALICYRRLTTLTGESARLT
jgi:hypothetical protein